MRRAKLHPRALERKVTDSDDWPPTFFEQLAKMGPELVEAVDEMTAAIHAGRHSKAAVTL